MKKGPYRQIARVAKRTLLLTEEILRDVKTQMPGYAAMSIKGKQELSGIVAKMMRAATPMLKEARQLIREQRDAITAMELDEQRALVVEIIKLMPAEHQKLLRAEVGW